jgi:hypothetical protein
MPALVLLGQPTIVSGDDIRWVCILIILLRLLQLAAVIPFLFYVVSFGPNNNNFYSDNSINSVTTAAAAAATSTTTTATSMLDYYSECTREKAASNPLVSKARPITISYGALTLFLAVSSIVLEAFM